MKPLVISPKSTAKIIRGERELSEKDILEIPKGAIPGEWVLLEDKQSNINYVGYINLFSANYYKIKILHVDRASRFSVKDNEEDVAKKIITENIQSALAKRKLFSGYESGARLIYGTNDSLSGLIVDKYEKYILSQINTAGLDRFRSLIRQTIQNEFKDHEVCLFDNEEYRKAEVLPIHENEKLADDLLIKENGFTYKVKKEVVQKIGYYYDHRENRKKLMDLIQRSNINKKIGVDLFSYVGSWGLHMLKGGVEYVDFVDQANMEAVTDEHLEMNNFKGRGKFTRSDVFKFLDKCIEENKQYDVIVSDPPAFTKSEKNKVQAISGYERLHTKCLKIAADESLFVAASCTHYVSFEELDKTVKDAAIKNKVNVSLLDVGVQGFDHPFSGLGDKSFYIKYLVYLVNRG